jgi:hypothetical protein
MLLFSLFSSFSLYLYLIFLFFSMSVACAKGTLEVQGHVTSDTSLTFITPDYTQFGSAQDVQCRLKIGQGGLTNTAVELKLFEVTSPR